MFIFFTLYCSLLITSPLFLFLTFRDVYLNFWIYYIKESFYTNNFNWSYFYLSNLSLKLSWCLSTVLWQGVSLVRPQRQGCFFAWFVLVQVYQSVLLQWFENLWYTRIAIHVTKSCPFYLLDLRKILRL